MIDEILDVTNCCAYNSPIKSLDSGLLKVLLGFHWRGTLEIPWATAAPILGLALRFHQTLDARRARLRRLRRLCLAWRRRLGGGLGGLLAARFHLEKLVD